MDETQLIENHPFSKCKKSSAISKRKDKEKMNWKIKYCNNSGIEIGQFIEIIVPVFEKTGLGINQK